ncbi:MAG: hypothetical protein CM1200mP30_22950 [Pseudomonadota bacterium]|nr:MAG: hypothetical protein CM1200mP30_22950 [Pseudomonadota bacterium]
MPVLNLDQHWLFSSAGETINAIEEVKKQVVATASLVEASIEFPEEDVDLFTVMNVFDKLNKHAQI